MSRRHLRSSVSSSGLVVALLLVHVCQQLHVPVMAAPLEDLVDLLPGMESSFSFTTASISLSSRSLQDTSSSSAASSSSLQSVHIRTPTPHFSGYLDATAGCDTESNGAFCRIHYWLALAEGSDPLSKPVVLWLNGGPGSSSLLGFLQENGPLMMTADGGLMENPWSWTKLVNLLALESPVGVGFSYCENQVLGQVCKNTDRYTASTSRAALQDFFNNKFPELASNDFFITGESYAGVYVPTLAKEILDNAPEIKLQGVAVGDPCTDNTAQANSMDGLWYGHKYGLVDDAIFDFLWNTCGARSPNLLRQGGVHWVAKTWNEHLKLKKVQLEDDVEMLAYARKLRETLIWNNLGQHVPMSPECTLAYRKFLLSTSNGLSQSWHDLFIDDYSLFAPVTNKEDDDMYAYMSRPDVRAALHMQESPVAQWPDPDVGFDYTKEFDACNPDAEPGAPSMIAFYQDIVPRLKVTWVYNGDTDPCVSYEGTRTAVKRMGFEELDGGGYRPWFYNMTGASLDVLAVKAPLFGPNLVTHDMGAQLGGEVVNYESGLSFFTFHGSGHMVPQFRPQAALHMIDRLVNYQDLSPLLPSNETLTKMNDEMFHTIMDKWTESAKSPPYVTPAPWDVASIETQEYATATDEY